MRFRATLELWIETDRVEAAEDATLAAALAAREAPGALAIDDPVSGMLAHTRLEPIDESAREGLAQDELGPGLEGWIRRATVD